MKLPMWDYNSTTELIPFQLLYKHINAKEPFELYYDNIYYQAYIQKHKERMKT